MVSHAIYDLDASKATGPDRIPAIVLKNCSPEHSPVHAWQNLLFLPVGNLHQLCQFLKMTGERERSDPGKYHPIKAYFLLLVTSLSLLLMIV